MCRIIAVEIFLFMHVKLFYLEATRVSCCYKILINKFVELGKVMYTVTLIVLVSIKYFRFLICRLISVEAIQAVNAV